MTQPKKGGATLSPPDSHVMRIVCLANGQRSPFDGRYLKEFDPDGGTNPYEGRIVVTKRVAEAKKGRKSELLELWRKRSKSTPQRPDGRPNRPLTAFSVEVLPVTKAEDVK